MLSRGKRHPTIKRLRLVLAPRRGGLLDRLGANLLIIAGHPIREQIAEFDARLVGHGNLPLEWHSALPPLFQGPGSNTQAGRGLFDLFPLLAVHGLSMARKNVSVNPYFVLDEIKNVLYVWIINKAGGQPMTIHHHAIADFRRDLVRDIAKAVANQIKTYGVDVSYKERIGFLELVHDAITDELLYSVSDEWSEISEYVEKSRIEECADAIERAS